MKIKFQMHYTVKNFLGMFPKIVGQLKIHMGRKFFQRYSRKYLRHRTGNGFLLFDRRNIQFIRKERYIS